MKFITAIIQSHELEAVKRELEAVEVNLITVTSVVEPEQKKSVKEIFGNMDKASGLLKKIRLDITINEDFVEQTIEAIVKGAHIDAMGEDKIFVF